jgi:putative ABC transport system permease protein
MVSGPMGVVGLASLRHFRRHPWQLGLAVLGIALGVGLAVGIDVANVSVRRAFTLSSDAVTGRATHQIAGGPAGVDEAVYRALRVARDRPDGLALAPFVGGTASPERGGGLLQVMGVDLFAEPPFRPSLAAALRGRRLGGDGTALLTRPRAAILSADTAARLGVSPGGALAVRAGARRTSLTLVGVWTPRDPPERRAFDNVAIVDVATAQELLGSVGRLSRIDLIVPDLILPDGTSADGASGDGSSGAAAALAWLQARLPPGLRVSPVAARVGALAQMTRAFDLNLRALSLLALLVGGFLIYNTMSFSVVQRRPVLAILRTLGVTRLQLGRNLLLEALALGLAGSVLGLLLGVALSRAMIRLTARAVSDLYFAVSVTDVPLAGAPLLRGLLLGVLAAVVSAWPAARDATATEPNVASHRSALESRVRARTPRLALASLAVIAAAAVVLALSRRSLPVALAALLALLTGCAGLAPAAVLLGARAASVVLAALRGATGRLAARSVASGLSRTGVATAALALALAVTTGVGLMVGSFRRSVEHWLQGTLGADVYISAPSAVSARPDSPLPAALVARVRAVPGIAATGASRVVTIDSDVGSVLLSALELPSDRPPHTELLAGDPRAAWPAFLAGEALLVSEPFSYKHRVKVGDALALATDRGRRSFRVAAVYRDYGSDAGALMLSRRTYDRYFDDPLVTAVSLYAAPGVTADELVARVRARLTADDAVLVRSNRALRESSLAIFDRTFEITSVLRLFAIVVAAFGVAGALMAVALERGRELGTLRALGATPAQVVELTILETGVLGSLAGILAVPLGTVLALVLVFVINRRSFGWTMPLAFDAWTLLLAPLLGAAAGVIAGLYPAWRAAHISPAAALREE